MKLFSLTSLLAILPTLSFAAPLETSAMESRAGKYVNFVYFTNWGIYGRNYQPAQLPSNVLTHVLYSFADIKSDGTVFLTDTYADLEKHYEGDSWNDVGNNAYGCIKQLFLLKKKNRNLKTLLSIGGWTYGPHFAGPMATEAGRQQFASSSVALVKDLGLDGIDIDWEYPKNAGEASDFTKLLAAVRTALDGYTSQYGGSRQILTAAMPAGPQNYGLLELANMNQYLDYFNLMLYDFQGGFSANSGHQANLYPSKSNPASTEFSTDRAITDYIAAGVPAGKIVMGLPLYGRSFEQTEGLGKPFNGIGQGSWEAGVWDFKVLPQAGATELIDSEAGASYSYDAAKKILISYDNLAMVSTKMDYLVSKNLGGAMFWEASGDRTGDQSLMQAAYNKLASSGGIAQSQNTLSYPGSQYANIAAGVP